jgi:probable F420-dependent oxidoreductase
MKFGINVINFAPGTTPASLKGWAAFAEDSCFHSLMISDHVALTPDVQVDYPAPFYDPFTVLSWLAGVTTRIELGTTVIILPYRHPLLTARLSANLDQLSGGRLIFGVGAGWAKREFEALGLPFDQRGAMSDEYLDVIKAAWTNDVLSFKGQFVAFQDVQTGPRPARAPHPPIWVGGSSEGALRRAARFADAWHPLRPPLGWLRNQGLPRLRQLAGAAGRPVPMLCPRISVQLTDRPLPEEGRLPGHGTAGQIRRDLRTLQELGTQHLLLDTYLDQPSQALHPESHWRLLQRLAAEVVDVPGESVRSHESD